MLRGLKCKFVVIFNLTLILKKKVKKMRIHAAARFRREGMFTTEWKEN